jgi:hypothetical protein
MSDSRRGFLAKMGALATAPVLTAFVADTQTGLAVPDRSIEIAQDLPPSPMVISSLMAPGPGFLRGDIMRPPEGQLVFFVNGEAWRIQAWKA